MLARAAVVGLVVVGLAWTSAAAQACTRTWASPVASGLWTTAADWDPAGVPTASDDVCLPDGGTYTVTVPAVVGGAHAHTLAIGGSGVGSPTLEIRGESTQSGGETVQGTTLTVSGGGTISAGGRLDLHATDTGTVRSPEGEYGGSATLAGGAFTNNGTIDARSDVHTNDWQNFLEVPLTNATGATIEVNGSLDTVLDYVGGTLQNDGTITVSQAVLVLGSYRPLSATHAQTQLANAGTITAATSVIEVYDARWTQAGGRVSGPLGPYLYGATLDYQSGTGSFDLTAGPEQLSGTIPAGETITVEGGVYTAPDGFQHGGATLTLAGDRVVNRGTLTLASNTANQPLGASVLQGAPLVNLGTLVMKGDTTGIAGDVVYLRTNLQNEPGGIVQTFGSLVQDAGTTTVNDGVVQVDAAYVLRAKAVSTSTFTNGADGVIVTDFSRRSTGVFDLGPGSAFNAGGALRPISYERHRPRQGQRFAALLLHGGSVTGAFATVGGGFGVDRSRPSSIDIVYGLLLSKVSGGRGRLALTVGCAASAARCPRMLVRATTVARTRRKVVTVATRRVTVAPGASARLILHVRSGGGRVTVTVTAGGTNLQRTVVRVLRA